MGGPSKRTKIVATIGPASDSEEMLRRLIDSGMDVARLNFSHRSAEQAKPLVERIRKVADEMGVFIGILGDLRGPRIRVGEMENGSIELQRGKKIILTSENTVGTPAKIAVSFKGLHRDVAPGSIVLLDDGNIELQVLEIRATGDVVCEIVRGGELKSNKGVNLKNRRVSLPSLTTKDYQDLDFAVSEFALNDPRIAVSSNEKEVTDTLLQLLDRLSSAPELAGLRANRSRLLCCTYLHHLRMQDSGGDYLQLAQQFQSSVLADADRIGDAMRLIFGLGEKLHKERTSIGLDQVRREFRLAGIALEDVLDHREDWSKLEEVSTTAKASVFTTIGSSLHLGRLPELKRVQKALETSRGSCLKELELGFAGQNTRQPIPRLASPDSAGRHGRLHCCPIAERRVWGRSGGL